MPAVSTSKVPALEEYTLKKLTEGLGNIFTSPALPGSFPVIVTGRILFNSRTPPEFVPMATSGFCPRSNLRRQWTGNCRNWYPPLSR